MAPAATRPPIIYACEGRLTEYVEIRSVRIGIRPEQHPEMLAGFDQRGGRLARAGIEPPVMREQPGEPGAARTSGRLAVEQCGKQPQRIDELAHRGAGLGVGRRREQKLQPRDAALGETRPGNPEAGAAANLPQLRVMRRVAEGFAVIPATDTTLLVPGDVIQVNSAGRPDSPTTGNAQDLQRLLN